MIARRFGRPAPPVPLARGARAWGAKATGEPGRTRVAAAVPPRGETSLGADADADATRGPPGSPHVSGPASPAPRRPSPSPPRHPPPAARRARVTTPTQRPGRHNHLRPAEAKMRAHFSGVRTGRIG
ncbi:hypothetical protein PVAP13_9NG239600 [Panicum virgatum]|uniref:Uncharacterized protein n=1 Tax=Panicum virgatum TaxID=38727 RepID=A0A8T0MKT6_PANVG|nr:hypothetical protein PVAP13_9NG239600 [Panicum virgatum]